MVNTPTREELRSQYGGGTLLYDAISDASKEVMSRQQGRKALVILSDGGENGSNATLASGATLTTGGDSGAIDIPGNLSGPLTITGKIRRRDLRDEARP